MNLRLIKKINLEHYFMGKSLAWRIILFVIILLMLTILFYFTSTLTSYQYYKDQVSLFKEKQLELHELQNKKSRLMLKKNEIITSGEEIKFFKQLLKNIAGFKLINFAKNEQKRAGDVYLSNYTLVFQGNYLTSLRYLQLLAQFGYKIVWHEAMFKVKQYPTGQLTLKIGLFSEKKQLFKA